jgi:hypothetical protein
MKRPHVRVCAYLSPDEMARFEHWRAARRLRRPEALRTLIRLALAARRRPVLPADRASFV